MEEVPRAPLGPHEQLLGLAKVPPHPPHPRCESPPQLITEGLAQGWLSLSAGSTQQGQLLLREFPGARPTRQRPQLPLFLEGCPH